MTEETKLQIKEDAKIYAQSLFENLHFHLHFISIAVSSFISGASSQDAIAERRGYDEAIKNIREILNRHPDSKTLIALEELEDRLEVLKKV